ncbi:hypothetical protein WJX73_008752 [Symbiochloris irregularis]|uniref:F-box domain-containing protein n=1 Tax=Symbiochloris irregularis TaxID=706552 RepID=A0AAW1NZ39_9CHLO
MIAAPLQAALAWHMLPRLDASDLGRLACTCRAGRELVALANPELWRRAAADLLPPRHPARHTSEVPVIRAALRAFAASQANLRTGRFTGGAEIPRALGTPKFSPNGRDFAVLVAADTQDSPDLILDTNESDILMTHSTQKSSSSEMQAHFCVVVYLEDGTKIPLLRRPQCWKWHRDWAWSRDGQRLICVDIPPDRPWLHVEVADLITRTRLTNTIPLREDVLQNFSDTRVVLSACGDCFALHLSSMPPNFPKSFIHWISGELVASSLDGYPIGDCSMPLWHPERLVFAAFCRGVLSWHDVDRQESREVARVPEGASARVQACEVECWSPCGSLLCFSYLTFGTTETTVVVVKADGSGTVFSLVRDSAGHATLSNAVTGLLSVWTQNTCEVFDMRTAAVIFKHTPSYVSPNERIGKATEFLFGGQMMSLVTVDPLEASSLETLSADDLEDGAFNTAVHAAETLLVNLRTQEAPSMGDFWVAEAQCGGG